MRKFCFSNVFVPFLKAVKEYTTKMYMWGKEKDVRINNSEEMTIL